MSGTPARSARHLRSSSADTRRRLFLEQLDRRDLMATLPTAFVTGGILYIDGTSQSDYIQVRFERGEISIPGIEILTEFGDVVSSIPRSSVPYVIAVGQAGNDRIEAVEIGGERALPMVIYGSEGDDVLIGGSADDAIFGMDGVDTIDGRGGNDRLYAALFGTSQDVTQFNIIPERIWGGTGNDQLYGSRGPDALDGGAGLDTVRGGEGNDTLTGGLDADTLRGDGGYDTLIETGYVNVTLTDYSLSGLRLSQYWVVADEVLEIEAAELSAVQNGLKFAMLDARGFGGRTVLRGTPDSDYLYGGRGVDEIWGGAGNDTLDGGAGSDTLWGEGGNDSLTGGLDADILRGGWGFDKLVETGFFSATLNNWSLSALRLAQFTEVVDTLAEFEIAELSAQNNGLNMSVLDARSFSGTVALWGTNGNDWLYGGSSHDRVYGGYGNDRIWGGAGNDTLVGGDGNDVIEGEAGDDTLKGADEYSADEWFGANDILNGGIGNDRIWGGAGHDNLFGGEGVDFLWGEAGKDGLFGGLHFDRLDGGADADRILLVTNLPDEIVGLEPRDAVIEFRVGEADVDADKVPRPAKNWTEQEVRRFDEALAVLHYGARDAELLKQSNDSRLIFARHAGQGRGSNDGIMHFTDMQIPGDNDTNVQRSMFLRGYIFHEIGHYWNGNQLGSNRWYNFQRISNWQAPDPRNAAFARATEQNAWYQTNTEFVSGYARNAINDDWAESFAAYFMDRAGWRFDLYQTNPTGVAGAAAAPTKMALVREWIVSL